MNIAILYIATGNYKKYWDNFYLSCEKYFSPKDNKTYFIFTDDKKYFSGNDKCIINNIQDEIWPYVTLKRYIYFNNIKNKLNNFDYIYFFNSNIIFNKEINLNYDFIGVLNTNNLNFYRQSIKIKKLSCYYPKQFKNTYAGYVLGGKKDNMLNMFSICAEAITKDLELNMIPINNDAAYQNWYINKYNITVNNIKNLFIDKSIELIKKESNIKNKKITKIKHTISDFNNNKYDYLLSLIQLN